MDPAASAGENVTVRSETVFDSGIGELMGRVIHGKEDQWLQVCMSGKPSTLY